MNQKNLKIFSLIIVVLSVVIVLICIDMRRLRLRDYDKYSLRITVTEEIKNKKDKKIINVRDDGTKASISSSSLSSDGYIVDNDLYYLKDDTFYIYSLDKGYRDVLGLINKIRDCDKVKTENEVIYYTTTLSSKKTNEILDALFFKKKTNSDCLVDFTVKNNRVETFNMTLTDMEGYDKVSLVLKFNELNDTYKVSTSKLFGSKKNERGSLDIVKFENTEENIYEVVK